MTDEGEVLESGLVADIPASKVRFEELVRFHWQYYSELAFQRNRIYDSLKNSLREHAKPFEFLKWQRAVKYKYSLDPLSTKGSLVDPGGRFNIGTIDPTRYPVFSGLYLASEKGTALAELLGRATPIDSLTPEQLALTKADSITAVSVSGKLESTLDVRERNNLTAFVHLVKDFKLSRALITKARQLGFPLQLLKTAGELTQILRDPNWRNWPMLYDVPTSSQIFGRIAFDAGIEAILYSSVLTQKSCLVIYPTNFQNSSSYVELDDPAPTETVQRRIDANSYKNFL